MAFLYRSVLFGFLLVFLPVCGLLAQAFQKGVLLVGVSEGSTSAVYTTNNNATADGKTQGNNDGNRDPLSIEYGLSKHWGIGVNLGTDIYKVNPETYYGFNTASGRATSYVSEVTIDGNYHFYDTRHTDIAAFLAAGVATVTLKGNSGDNPYQYNASGGIVRTGIKAKYYFRKRFGLMGIVSAFSTSCSTAGIKGNTVATSYATGLTGTAIEFGFCYRFF